MVAGNMQRRRVYDTQWTLLSKPNSNTMLEQNTAFFIARAVATSSASIVDCAVSPCSATFKLIRVLTSVTIYDDVDLSLSGLLP